MTPKEALTQYEWLADKLAYWSGHDISELDEQYNYSGLLGQVYQALTELEELKQEIKDRQETEESLGKELIKLGDELEVLKRYPTSDEVCEALDGLAQFIIMNDNGTDESASAIEWHNIIKQSITQQQEKEQRAKKVEELLGLIKERARIDNDLSMAETKHDRDVIRVLWWENNAKIQALEEELT